MTEKKTYSRSWQRELDRRAVQKAEFHARLRQTVDRREETINSIVTEFTPPGEVAAGVRALAGEVYRLRRALAHLSGYMQENIKVQPGTPYLLPSIPSTSTKHDPR
jgi:hypothetical protein